MRRTVTLSVAVALAVLLVSGVWGSAAGEAEGTTAKPNIVFILADDMRKDDLKYMPKTRSVLGDKGMTFSNAFVSNALCCPTRATIMRGQYAHNTGVWSNKGSSGGLRAFRNNGNEKDNVATRLDAAGYRTGLFGKYLNQYSGTKGKPPGWDRWFAHTRGSRYYNYKINDDGRIINYGSTSADYETDGIAKHAKTFIGTTAKAGMPFFAYVAPRAPHSPATPATRDKHTYDGLKAPRLPSFDEQNVADKPPWIRKLPRLSDAKKAKIDKRAEKRAETLQALDDLVAGIVGELNNSGVLSNTYVFFTSDNGWHAGEHRIPQEKWRPYEEDVHMPLLARGPGVAATCPPLRTWQTCTRPNTSMDAPCSLYLRGTPPPGGAPSCSKLRPTTHRLTEVSARATVASMWSTRAERGSCTTSAATPTSSATLTIPTTHQPPWPSASRS
jgi:N-acetylglucosamine-6-sulfatase